MAAHYAPLPQTCFEIPQEVSPFLAVNESFAAIAPVEKTESMTAMIRLIKCFMFVSFRGLRSVG